MRTRRPRTATRKSLQSSVPLRSKRIFLVLQRAAISGMSSCVNGSRRPCEADQGDRCFAKPVPSSCIDGHPPTLRRQRYPPVVALGCDCRAARRPRQVLRRAARAGRATGTIGLIGMAPFDLSPLFERLSAPTSRVPPADSTYQARSVAANVGALAASTTRSPGLDATSRRSAVSRYRSGADDHRRFLGSPCAGLWKRA